MTTRRADDRERGAHPERIRTDLLDRVFLLANALMLLLLVAKLQQSLLPGGLASQVGHNSEVFALALALGWGIALLRGPTVSRDRRRATALAAASLVLAGVIYWSGTPTTVKTLNEPLLAAGLITFYCLIPRPLPRLAPWFISGFLAVVIVLWSQVDVVFQQAESVTALMVAPLALDVVDRSVLEPARRRSSWVWVWICALVLTPAGALATGSYRTASGHLPEVVDYLARGAEGFWGIALLQVYFLARRRVASGGPLDHPRPGIPKIEHLEVERYVGSNPPAQSGPDHRTVRGPEE